MSVPTAMARLYHFGSPPVPFSRGFENARRLWRMADHSVTGGRRPELV